MKRRYNMADNAMDQQLPSIAQWIITWGTVHYYLIYAVIVILACAEGPWLSLIFGVLIRLGAFPLWPVYISLMLGDLIGDVAWYWIGRKYGYGFVARHGKRFSITKEHVEKLSRLFHRYKDKVLFISKISNGFGLALVTLMTAGLVKLPFWRYMVVNVIGQLIWTGMLLAVGYWYSHLYISIGNIMGKASLIAGAVVILFAGYGYSRYLRDKLEGL